MKFHIVLILKVFVTNLTPMARFESLFVAELFEVLRDALKIVKLAHGIVFADF